MTERSQTEGRSGPQGGSSLRTPGAVTLGAAFPLALAVIAVSAIVAVAANGGRILAPAAASDAWWIWVVRVLGVGVLVGGLGGLVRERRRMPVGTSLGGDPTAVALRAAATMMLAVTLVALFNPPERVEEEREEGAGFGLVGLPPFGRGGSGPSLPATARGSDSQIRGTTLPGELEREVVSVPAQDDESRVIRRAVNVLVWLFFLLIAWMYFRSLKRRVRVLDLPEPVVAIDPEEAAASLEASLDALLTAVDTGEPRGQITHAYLRLLGALASAGARREPQEAPHEHLHRALGPLGVEPGPLHRLAGLYVLAQFSERPITDEHRAAAAHALEESLGELRAATRAMRRGPGPDQGGAGPATLVAGA